MQLAGPCLFLYFSMEAIVRGGCEFWILDLQLQASVCPPCRLVVFI